MKNEHEILSAIVSAIHDTTGMEKGKILPSSWLIKDVGAESIDFLDINYELERVLGCEVDFRKIFRTKKEELQQRPKDIQIEDVVRHILENQKN